MVPRPPHRGPYDPGGAPAMSTGHPPPGSPFPPEPPCPPPAPPGTPGGLFGPGTVPPGAAPKVKKGDVRAAALTLLAEGPRNGYQIIQQIGERSRGIWRPSPGSVYPALQQLQDEGMVRAQEDGGRRTYRITDAGRAHLSARGHDSAPWERVAESVSAEMLDTHGLLGQVGMAMRQVMMAGTPGQRAEARNVLTGARRSLYRILAEDHEEER